MEALKLLNEGKLDEAVAAATDAVRNAPANTALREILCELFCLQGDLLRADKQADTILVQEPQAAVTASLLRQLIRAETMRQECWREGRVPEFIGEPDEVCKRTLASMVAVRAEDPAVAMEELNQLADGMPELSGTCNSIPFEGFRDLDDMLLGVMEVLTSTGKYFMVPFSRIVSAEFAPVARPRDLLWRQCEMTVEDGPHGVVYIPSLYIDTDQSEDSPLRLGRATEWIETPEHPVRGLGQRLFAAGDLEIGVMDIESLTINQS